ncbi:LysE/ArgO family amino acid transporter [Paraoerskovia sediminicola]|nr:LysE/ArgO family amino acid transporter [Paraoerskovia sediminicola]
MTTALAGMGFGLALIVAIGAQNAYVLRQGLRGEHVGAVVAICIASDAVLITVGAAGLGGLIAAHQGVLTIVTVLGAAVLVAYAVLSARRALRPGALVTSTEGARVSLGAVAGTTLALTWLNPHVYLDTVVLLGSVSAAQGDGRWWFAVGAVLGSTVWFCVLGFGAAALRPVFAKPMAWRVLDGVIAAIMLALAVKLLLGLAG